jgi:hypothetical protein
VYGCFEDQYDAEKGGDALFEVVKAHKFNPKWVEWAEAIITVFREPTEVLESMKRFGAATGREYDEHDALRGLSWLAHYNYHADYFINFEQIERCPEKLADQIAQRIGLKIRPKRVVEEFLRIVPPAKGYDPVTLLHAKHITR